MGLRPRLYSRLFAVGCFFHLTLPDAHQLAWLVPNLSLAVGALWLLAKPPTGRLFPAPWLLCALGVLGPLLFAGDQLTQSVFLLVQCAVMLSARGDPSRAAPAMRGCTVAFYAIAAFHKLNSDFFDASVSCATGGVRLLGENWSVALPDLGAGWPILFIVVELGVAVLWVARPALAVVLASAMHLPLTIVFAPAFAWVMIPAWVWFFDDETLSHQVTTFRDKRVLGVGSLLGVISAAFYFRDHWVPYPFWQLNELALWIVLVGSVRALWTRPGVGRGAWGDAPLGWRAVFVLALVLNATTPYLGLQFHHAGAMLSNLRIDRGCWNHLIVPEEVRLRDPYLRIDDARDDELESTLWHPAQLRDWLAEHCEGEPMPVTLDGERLDACALELSGSSGLFQTNLQRECPQRCIH